MCILDIDDDNDDDNIIITIKITTIIWTFISSGIDVISPPPHHGYVMCSFNVIKKSAWWQRGQFIFLILARSSFPLPRDIFIKALYLASMILEALCPYSHQTKEVTQTHKGQSTK